MSRSPRVRVALLALALVTSPWTGGFFVRTAFAADAPSRVDRAMDELRNNEDFRVRTQAALALGASKDKRAVSPLCEGLDDSSATVRAAAAAALGKLAMGGIECVKSHLSGEQNTSVKSVLAKTAEALKTTQKPAVTVETKYYVAIGPTTDKTGRTGSEVDDLVRGAVEQAVSDMDGYVVAPRTETATEAKAVTTKWKKIKAFFLWPKVMAPDYAGGNLTVRFEIAVFTYPGKAMKGTIPLKLTMSDVQQGDKDSENDLIRRAAGSALERFATAAERFAQ